MCKFNNGQKVDFRTYDGVKTGFIYNSYHSAIGMSTGFEMNSYTIQEVMPGTTGRMWSDVPETDIIGVHEN